MWVEQVHSTNPLVFLFVAGYIGYEGDADGAAGAGGPGGRGHGAGVPREFGLQQLGVIGGGRAGRGAGRASGADHADCAAGAARRAAPPPRQCRRGGC